MRKILFSSTLSVLVSLAGMHTARAQSFTAGVMAGVSATQISGDQLAGFNKAGIVAGGLVQLPLSERMSLEMEILYFQKGSKKNADPENNDFESYLLRLNYFEVPLLLQYNSVKKFVFEAGPTFGALVSTKEEDQYGELSQPRAFRKFEFGVAGGMKFEFVKNCLFVARYGQSLIPVREHQSGATYRLNAGQYSSTLVFAFQYLFRKNKTG